MADTLMGLGSDKLATPPLRNGKPNVAAMVREQLELGIDEAAALADLVNRMRFFDWHFRNTEDHRVFTGGYEAERQLYACFFRCPRVEREALWAELAPKTPSGETWPMPLAERNSGQ